MAIYQINPEANRISKDILDAAFYIHTHLGPGLLEKAYEDSLNHILVQKGLQVERQKVLPVKLEDIYIESGFRADLIVENAVIVELKACEKILPIHEAQLHTYLKLSGIHLGLILNFNVSSMKNGIRRIAKAPPQKETSSDFV